MGRLLLIFVLCAGCALDEAGVAATDGGPGASDVVTADVVVPDVGTDVVEEPGPPAPCTTDSGVCSGAVPQGWTLTAFAPNQTTTCPANFTSSDVVSSPAVQSDACTCGCNITTQPSCALGNVTLKYALNNQCGNTYGTFDITTEGACTDFNNGTFTLTNYHSYTDLGLTQGVCSSPAPTADTNKLTATPMRTCAPPAACAEDVCNGTVPAGLRACIVGAGDVTCPPGPFTDKVAVIGAKATLSCDTCTTCSITESPCGAGTVKFWGDSSCTTAKGSITADGNCNPTGGASGVNHFTYVNPVQNVQCNAGTSAATAALDTPQTVCCR